METMKLEDDTDIESMQQRKLFDGDEVASRPVMTEGNDPFMFDNPEMEQPKELEEVDPEFSQSDIMQEINQALEMDDDFNEFPYVVEFNQEYHFPKEIYQYLFIGLKEREECLSSVVLKLFDILFEKDLDYTIMKSLVMDFF
jgi:hypothetical protein